MKTSYTIISQKLRTSMIVAGGGVILFAFNNTPCAAQFYDDFSIYEDSSYYTDGKDIIWLYGEDTGYVFPGEDTTVSMEGYFPDDMNAAFALPIPPEDISSSLIHITPGLYPKNITKGVFGLNLADMFNTYNLPDDISSADQWLWLAELQPQVIRIPSGSPVMFSHLLPYKDADNNEVLDPILGLGYDIYEIARYFDRTDGVMDYPVEAQIFSFNIAEL